MLILASLKPPDLFDFTSPSDWPTWIEDYSYALSLQEKDGKKQARTLLYTMGRKARKILPLCYKSSNVLMLLNRSFKCTLFIQRTWFMRAHASTSANKRQAK